MALKTITTKMDQNEWAAFQRLAASLDQSAAQRLRSLIRADLAVSVSQKDLFKGVKK